MNGTILVTGASGQLGAYLLQELAREADQPFVAWCGSPGAALCGAPRCVVNLAEPTEVVAAFEAVRPAAVIHAAAISRIDVCHARPQWAEQVNVHATRQLAELADDHKARLVYVSTDLVFDGHQGGYRESDPAAPLSCYGRTKLAGESPVLASSQHAVARVSLLFGPARNGQASFFDQQCSALREQRALKLFTDEWRTPLSLATAARALIALARSSLTGIVHLGGPERMSRWEMGQRLAASLGCDTSLLQAARQSDATFPEPRPRDVSLDSSRWRAAFPDQPWPDWDQALREMI